jgi:hypothetical protein
MHQQLSASNPCCTRCFEFFRFDYFWVKTRIDVKADHGANDTDVRNCFGLVGGAGGLPARQQFFRYTYFILGDTLRMPTDSTLERQTEEGA